MSNICQIAAGKKYASRYAILVTPEIPLRQKLRTPCSSSTFLPHISERRLPPFLLCLLVLFQSLSFLFLLLRLRPHKFIVFSSFGGCGSADPKMTRDKTPCHRIRSQWSARRPRWCRPYSRRTCRCSGLWTCRWRTRHGHIAIWATELANWILRGGTRVIV